MNVLFISSGNDDRYNIAPFIKSQGESLQNSGVNIDYYTIKGKGLINYLKNIGPLRKHVKSQNYDLLHAHYSLCGWVAVLSFSGLPIVLSLMGADAVGTPTGKNRLTIKSKVLSYLTLLVQPFVSLIISKSPNIEKVVYRKDRSVIIPNGVRMDQFNTQPEVSKKSMGLSEDVRHVLFLGSPHDKNKNIQLVKSSLRQLNLNDVELLNVFDVPHNQVVQYLLVSDVVSLCSFSEGSPNVVKEAMACNKPIVATNVGDVAWLLEGLEGCYVSDHSVEDFSRKVEKALIFAKEYQSTTGRDQLYKLGLDAKSTADRIIELYHSLIDNKQVLTI